MLLCFVILCFLTSCRKTVSVVELQSVRISSVTSYHYKVIGADGVVSEIITDIKMKKGDKTITYE